MARRAVFLDRDGVLNDVQIRSGHGYPPLSQAELEIYAYAPAACAALRKAGFVLIGATNQPGIARGTATRAAVDEINTAVTAALGLDDLRMCPHDNPDACHCRKPKPGLLTDAARDFDIDLVSSIMVGDRWSDVEAGAAAGCRTVFIDRGYDEPQPDSPDYTCADLSEAVAWITKTVEY